MILFIIQLIIVIFLIIFLTTLFFNFFIEVPYHQKLYHHLNNDDFNIGGKKDKCPKGCSNKKCLYPLHCLNCNGEDPDCCCNDEQCKDC
jgi:hypothetical protein